MLFIPQNILLAGSVLFLISIFASRAAYRFGVPVLLLFLIIGMLFGSDRLGIQFNNASSAQFIGILALTMIFFPGYMIGLLITFVMVVVARPAVVFLSLLPFRKLSNRAKHYVSWVGLKGAIPIIFATYPLTAGEENAGHMFNIIFFVTLISLIIQGTTINFAAEKLKLSNPPE